MKKFLIVFAALTVFAACNRSPEFYFKRGNYLVATGKPMQALENYNHAIILKRSYPEALTARGMLYERQNDRPNAEADYLKAIEADGNYIPAYNNLAAFYMDADNYRKAIDYLDTALRIKPKYEYALLNRGLSYYKLGDCAKAKQDLTEALSVNPRFDMALYHRGKCFLKENNYYGAAKDFGDLVKINPSASAAWVELGKIKAQEKDFKTAAQFFQKAVLGNERDFNALYNYAYALMELKDRDDALKIALEAEKENGEDCRLSVLLADIYGAEDRTKASEYYSKASGLCRASGLGAYEKYALKQVARQS